MFNARVQSIGRELLPQNFQRYATESFFFLEAHKQPQALTPFLSPAKEKGEKKRRKGLHAPLNPPVGLLAQKAVRLETVPLSKCGWPHSKSVFYFHGPHAAHGQMAMERGTLFFVRPMPPKGGGGIPVVLNQKHWSLTVRAPKFSNAERRRGY